MIVIVDYGMGNLGSIGNMLKRIGISATRTTDPEAIARAERLVLPGVGAFDQGIQNLEEMGLREVLTTRVMRDKVPVLGICLGMQLMAEGSEEGSVSGLGWISGRVRHLRHQAEDAARELRFPHIGWNFIIPAKAHPVLDSLPDNPRFYFVHTYKLVCADEDDVLARVNYGRIQFTCAFARDNIVGVQFHPEKSHRFGMALLKSFASWDGAVVRPRAGVAHG